RAIETITVRTAFRQERMRQYEHHEQHGGRGPSRGGRCTTPTAALREHRVRQEQQKRRNEKELETRLAIPAGGRGAAPAAQSRQRIAHASALVRGTRADEDAARRVCRRLERGRRVTRHDDLPRDIPFECRALSAA